MNDWLESIYQGILFTPILEWVAVFAGVLYVIFAARQRMLCWFFAFVSSAIYVWLCFTNELYLETILQVFYVLMAVYGWQQWTKASKREQTDEEELVLIKKWPWSYHLLSLLLGACLTFGLGYYFESALQQKNAYLDAFTTVFSFVATFMVTARVVENWLYWIVIDAVSIYLYYTRDLKLSALLFMFFTVLAIYGYFKWRKANKMETQSS